jgi:fructose-bisphosphate aldolase, class I
MKTQVMETTTRMLVAAGKGILAADESSPTIEKRFTSINVPSTEENPRDYRELLVATPGLGEFISGVILFDETIRQKAADGTPLVEAQHALYHRAGCNGAARHGKYSPEAEAGAT